MAFVNAGPDRIQQIGIPLVEFVAVTAAPYPDVPDIPAMAVGVVIDPIAHALTGQEIRKEFRLYEFPVGHDGADRRGAFAFLKGRA